MQPGTPIPNPAFPSSGFALLPESDDPGRFDITLFRGGRFTMPVQYPTTEKAFRAVTGVTQTAPVRLTVAAHGLPEGWPFTLSGLLGPVTLNSGQGAEPYTAHVVDADTIEISDVNGAGLPLWTSGGFVEFFLPMDLTGRSGQVLLREYPGAVPLVTINDATDVATVGRVTVEVAASRIDLDIAEEITAQLSRDGYTWSLLVMDAQGNATPLLFGNVRVIGA